MIVSFAVFAPLALLILTGPDPSAVLRLSDGVAGGAGHAALVYSLVADGLAWITCLVACFMIVRFAHLLRDRVPFGLTTYLLGLFLVCFALERLAGYLPLWGRLRGLGGEIPLVRAAASVVVAMGLAVLFPYVRSMVRAVIAANKEHEQFIVAAESSLDAFYLFDSVRDTADDVVDFRFSYVNANGEKRLRKPRTQLLGTLLSDQLPFALKSELIERYREVVTSGTPLTEERLIELEGVEPYWIAMQVVKLGDGVMVTNRNVTEERARQHEIENLNEFTQSMIENAPFSIIATDPAGTVTAIDRKSVV